LYPHDVSLAEVHAATHQDPLQLSDPCPHAALPVHGSPTLSPLVPPSPELWAAVHTDSATPEMGWQVAWG